MRRDRLRSRRRRRRGRPPTTEALALSALTGPAGADLYIEAPAGATAFEHVHVQIRAPEGSDEQANRIVNLKDVAAPGGEVGRGATVRTDVHVREESPPRTGIHRGETIVKLRPDLVVAAVHAPPQTLRRGGAVRDRHQKHPGRQPAGNGGGGEGVGASARPHLLQNTVSSDSPEYSIGGLPVNAEFTLAVWNATGDGTNAIAGTVTTDAAGVARFEVPLHAAFSLTTAPVS